MVGTAGVEAIYVLLARFPSSWWLLSAALFVFAIALMANLAPTFFCRMFYKFRPLEHESLRSRLVALSTRAGVPVLGVYEWAIGGEDTAGECRARRVRAGRDASSSPTRCLRRIRRRRLKSSWRTSSGTTCTGTSDGALVVESVLVLAAFFCAASVLNLSWRTLGLTSPADIAGLPLLLLAGGGIMQAATPLVNGLSRRNERRADGYALAMTEQPAAFISAMKRLGAQNLAEENPSRAVLWLFHSHPPVAQRIEAAQATRTTFNVPL